MSIDTESKCECDILPLEDRRDYCPEHKTTPQRRVSVGRTQPLIDVFPTGDATDRIAMIYETAYWEGEYTHEQRSIMRWAVNKCRALDRKHESLCEEL